GTTASAVPVGFEEDGAYLGGALQRLVAATLAVPPRLRQVRDPEAHRRLTLVHLLRARDLRLISAWHPSFLTLLLDGLRRDWNGLLRDLAWPARARELRAVGPHDVRGIWPHLALVSVWGDGHAAGALSALRARLPGIEIQPKGLLATEGIVTLPFTGHMPLAVRSHFFEFLDHRGAVRRAWELEEGQSYSVVVTTGGGLYRYRLHDCVTVAGFLRETPCLRFLGKDDRVSDRCGEKLAEGFVAAVLERVLGRRGIPAAFAMLAPKEPGYALFLETAAPVPADLGDEIDTALRENPAYAHCRRLHQLGPVDVRPVPAGAYGRYTARLRELGQRLGDVKPLALDPRSRWEEVL
ncbi:MAG TPA: GH3 auxin-responsive promoter family protein, partial [Candidatus Polarisedimenticolaceae bacterium]|nr:GH3 auxin-responsive promoter family protein [Candidatus Polarisedimenticolaceae bacterium]